MKHVYGLLIAIVLVPAFVSAQDEGQITKKARIERSNNIFFSAGPSFTFGKNIGDYSTGLNIEAGFTKRVNRLLSIGPSISYIKFKYDPEETSADDGNAFYGTGTIDTEWYGSIYDNWSDKYDVTDDMDFGYVLSLKGGDLSLISLACNIKLNLVPVKDTSPLSVYLFVKPFVTQYSRKAVTGTGTRYVYEAYEDWNGDQVPGRGTPDANESNDWLYYNQGDDTWYADGYEEEWGPESFSALEEKKAITGGVFLGPGFEFLPAKKISIFLQPMIGYTFPISFVSTKSYDNTVDSYVKDEFPIVKKGFSSLNVQVGVSYNF